MNDIRFISNLPIRYKLLLCYLAAFIIIITIGFGVFYTIVRTTIEANIKSELKNSTEAMRDMVQTAVSLSIKNYLRAVAEKDLDMVHQLYAMYREGDLSQTQAKHLAESVLLSQRIGTTGYVACISTAGIMVVHPEREWVGKDINRYDFVAKVRQKRQGYIEYHWQNPGETAARPKAMYMTYFEPWDWIIVVSSYRNEFRSLVDIQDFRASVLSLRFSQSGYAFVTDNQGQVIIHPNLEKNDVMLAQAFPERPLQAMLRQKTGQMVYPWRNPGERQIRQKLVFFNYIPEYEWLVASASYLDEFYAPLNKIQHIMIITVLGCILLVLPITVLISSGITNPLAELVDGFEKGAQGDLSVRLNGRSRDEVGRLAEFFNAFMERLENYNRNLETEIKERKGAEAALRVSESRYRSVIEALPDPMVVYDMAGNVTYLNPAFTEVFEWTPEECLGKKMDHFVPAENWEETCRGIHTITSGKMVSSLETRRLTKSGHLIDVSIRGGVYRDLDGRPVGSVIIHRDVSDLKRLEKEVMDIGDRERQKIGQDLHDDLCPHLIGIEGLSKVLIRKLSHSAPQETLLAEKITGLVKDAITKTRGLARGLCPVYLVDRGLEASLRELAANTQAMLGITCSFECKVPVVIRDNLVATHLFYIIQEAVHNAVRHGHPETITISMKCSGERVILQVYDDGCGLPVDLAPHGMGLRIMGFRANMIRAGLDIRAYNKGGTLIEVTMNKNTALPVSL